MVRTSCQKPYMWSTVNSCHSGCGRGQDCGPVTVLTANLVLAFLVLNPQNQARVKNGFPIAMGMTVEIVFGAPVLVTAVGWEVVYVGLPFSLWG